MSRPNLSVVHCIKPLSEPIPFSEKLADHHAILRGYLDTHITRNHSNSTIYGEEHFLQGSYPISPISRKAVN